MKRILPFIFVFIISACNITEYDKIENATVTNNASVSLTFKIDGSPYTLANGAHRVIQTTWTGSVEFENNPRAVFKKYYDYANGNALKIDFTDMTAYQFTIKNNAAVEVTVSEKNNLLGSTYGEKVTVAAGIEKNVTFYTDKPDVAVDTNGNFTITVHDKVIIIN